MITKKGDGTLLIHGNSLMKPLNFQRHGASMSQDDNKLISKNKGETITITIENVLHYYELSNWSNNKINLNKTEEHLRQQIIENIDKYFTNIKEIHVEFGTPVGPIDLLVIEAEEIYHIIEIKRKKASLQAASQLVRYVGYFIEKKKNCHGYIMSPGISKGALRHLEEHNLEHINVDFES